MDSEAVTPKRRARSQRGETLLESLIAMMLLSIVALPAFAGIQMALKASVLHHEVAISETLLRSAAEELQNPSRAYIPLAGCPGHGNYTGLPIRPRYSPVAVKVQFWTPQTASVNSMSLLSMAIDPPAVAEFSAAGTCPSADPGLQKIRLSVVTPSGRTQTLIVLKRGN